MKQLLKIIAVFTLCYSCSSHDATTKLINKWNDEISAENNVALNAVNLTGDDFSFLDKLVKDKSVIILGEASHYDLTTTEQKIKMIKHLQKLGFNSVAFEGASFLTSYFYNKHEYRHTLGLEKPTIMSPVWYLQSEFAPMFDVIKDGIKLVGMENNVMSPQDFIAAEIIMNKYNNIKKIEWDRLNLLYDKFYNSSITNTTDSLSDADKYEYISIINEIHNNIERIKLEKSNKIDTDLDALQQWIVNARRDFFNVSTNIYSDVIPSSNQIILDFNARDRQMADNVMWYLEHNPKDKIIVWCHNFHAAKAISQVYNDEIQDYIYIRMLGENLYDKLGEQLYSIAFTSLNSNEVYFNSSEFEENISHTSNNSSYAFIDFQKLRFEDKYDEAVFEAAMLGKKRGHWLNVFDGVYFIKQQNNSNITIVQ